MAQKQELTTRKYLWSAGQKVTTSASSAQSTAIQADEVLLSADEDMYIAVGTNPTAAAAAGGFLLASGVILHIQITPGDKIAAIQKTAAGGLYIVPVL